jgi:hypothetical protein
MHWLLILLEIGELSVEFEESTAGMAVVASLWTSSSLSALGVRPTGPPLTVVAG